MKEDEPGAACDSFGEKINGVSVGKLEGKCHFKGLGLDVRLILKKILRKRYK
jgi:hypothetical protein